MRLSHVLCHVPDLAAAVADYRRLGFAVEWGSSPPTATNALIRFGAGPFLELLTVGAPAGRVDGVFGRQPAWAAGRGWVDVAVETTAELLDGEFDRLTRLGVPCTTPARHRRVRADGVVLTWWILAPEDPALPFVMSAYQPPQPAPGGVHANGVTGIGRVVVGSPEPERASARWLATLGTSDPLFEFVPAARDGVVDVRLSGPSGLVLDPGLLHGAVLSVAPRHPSVV